MTHVELHCEAAPRNSHEGMLMSTVPVYVQVLGCDPRYFMKKILYRSPRTLVHKKWLEQPTQILQYYGAGRFWR